MKLYGFIMLLLSTFLCGLLNADSLGQLDSIRFDKNNVDTVFNTIYLKKSQMRQKCLEEKVLKVDSAVIIIDLIDTTNNDVPFKDGKFTPKSRRVALVDNHIYHIFTGTECVSIFMIIRKNYAIFFDEFEEIKYPHVKEDWELDLKSIHKISGQPDSYVFKHAKKMAALRSYISRNKITFSSSELFRLKYFNSDIYRWRPGLR